MYSRSGGKLIASHASAEVKPFDCLLSRAVRVETYSLPAPRFLRHSEKLRSHTQEIPENQLKMKIPSARRRLKFFDIFENEKTID